MDALEALEKLKQGNKRFVAGENEVEEMSELQRLRLAEKQKPFAVILGCSDSRVPIEHVFDQGFGSLFVIRVAGNVVAPSLIGSVEYAVEALDTRLVVVLGHTNCGAVGATLDALQNDSSVGSPNLSSILRRIQPAVSELLHMGLANDHDKLMHHAVRSNVRASVGHLKTGSHLLEMMSERGALTIVGATYSLETGEVDFFEGID